ncbi:hypothetical protein F3J10_24780 [Burkholderia sp. Cy-637]|nr:hypothetical protein [Burkholderia sp. Cy-637]
MNRTLTLLRSNALELSARPRALAAMPLLRLRRLTRSVAYRGHRHAALVRIGFMCATLAVNGLYRHGFMIAPEVAQAAVEFVQAWFGGALGNAGQPEPEALAAWRAAARWPALFRTETDTAPARA